MDPVARVLVAVAVYLVLRRGRESEREGKRPEKPGKTAPARARRRRRRIAAGGPGAWAAIRSRYRAGWS